MEEQKENLEETIIVERKSLEYQADDADLVKAINSAVAESKKLKDIVDDIGRNNETYWKKGTNISTKDIHPKKARIVVNRIFMSVETVIPMLVSRTPEPTIIGNVDNKVREKLIKVLTIAYDVKQKLQLKIQSVIRHWFLYRIGILKYRWDEGFITENVRPEKIGLDPRATEKGNCEFIYEQMEDTIGDLIAKYPDKKDKITAQYGSDRMKSKVGYLEFWGGSGEWYAHKLGEILLDKQKNPNFDYTEEGNNLFKKAQFPYLLLNVFNLGKNLYDDASLIEQSIPIQDSINKRKNQISDLSDEQKKLIVASSKAIGQEEFQKFIDKYGMLGLWLDNGEIGDVKVVGGQADAAMFNDLSQSINEVDNLMGTHSTTRGERKEQETLGGRRLLTSADFGRTETIVLRIEQLLEDWYNAYLHMIKVYSSEDIEFSDGEQTVSLSKEEIPQGVLVMIKKNSTLPVDRATRADMAVKLAQFGIMAPADIYEDLGYGNAQKRVENLLEWQQQQAGQQAGGQGGGQASPEEQQLAQLKQIMSSPEFKKLPPEKQKAMVERAREIVNRLKGGQ